MNKCKKHRTTDGRIVFGGCCHYGSGNCRLDSGRKCEFGSGKQCYICCSFLNSRLGKAALQIYNEEKYGGMQE